MAVRGLLNRTRFFRPFASPAVAIRPTSTSNEQPSTDIWAALQRKTGETGKYILGIGVAATLFSKEIIVVHNETLIAMSMFGVIYWLMKRAGPQVSEFLDNRAQNILDNMNASKNATMAGITDDIAKEENVEVALSCRDEIFEIQKDESDMEREEEYRRRLSAVRNEVVRRLDYQHQVELLQREFEKRHLVSWLEDGVRQALVSKQDDGVQQCVASLKKLATA